MKIKNLLTVAIAAFIIAVAIPNEMSAQRVIKNYNEALTINPVALAFNQLPINYEMQISRDNSISVGLVYYAYSFQDWAGFGVSGMYKWYLFQEQDVAIKGFGFGPSLALGYFSFGGKKTDNMEKHFSLAIGAEANYKFIFDDFVLEPVLGINYDILNKSEQMKWQAFYFGFNVGYAW